MKSSRTIFAFAIGAGIVILLLSINRYRDGAEAGSELGEELLATQDHAKRNSRSALTSKLSGLKGLSSNFTNTVTRGKSESASKSLAELIEDYESARNDFAQLQMLDLLCERLAQHPDIAEAWLVTKENRTFNTDLFETFANHYTLVDPLGADRMLARLPTDLRSTAFLVGILKAHASYNIEGSYVRLESESQHMEPAQTASAVRKIFASAVDGHSLGNLASVIGKIPDEGVRNIAREAIINTRIQARDFSGIASWVAESSSTGSGPKCFGRLMKSWSQFDKESAEGWLVAQPPGLAKDAGIEQVAIAAARSDPEKSLGWLASISDPASRLTLIEETFSTYYRDDPTSALITLENLQSLSRSEKSTLRERVGDPTE